jgi:hypothetical protein
MIDLGISKERLIDNIATVILALCVLWFRMFVHYVG